MDDLDILFLEMIRRIDNRPELVCTLDYKMMCDFIFVLFARNYKDICKKCVIAAYEKYGAKVFMDLRINSIHFIRVALAS